MAIRTAMSNARAHGPDARQRISTKPNNAGYPAHGRGTESATKVINAINAGVVAVGEGKHVTVELQ